MSNNCNIPPNNSGLESCFKIFNKINTHKRIEWRFNNRTGCKYPGITIHRLAAKNQLLDTLLVINRLTCVGVIIKWQHITN